MSALAVTSIDVQKTPDSQMVVVGDSADFTITVTNTGDVPLTLVTVVDALAPDCDRLLGVMAAGASTSYTCSSPPMAVDHTNSVTVTGLDPLLTVATDTDTAFVDAILPGIDVEKTPDSQMVVVGDAADFTITVTNTGDVPLTLVTVVDALAPDCDRLLGDMAAGASTSYSCSSPPAVVDFTNTAIATGLDPNLMPVLDSDTADVDAVSPAIDVEKTPDSQMVVVGDAADFTITVTNTGDVPLTSVTVVDALAPDCDRVLGGMTAGASTSYTCSSPSVTADHTNSVTVTGQDPLLMDATDTDTAFVDAISGAPGESSISGVVYEDQDADGIRDPGEPGVDTAVVILTEPGADGVLDTPDDSTQTTVTSGGGLYGFSGLLPGQHRLSIDPSSVPGGLATTGSTMVPVLADEALMGIDLALVGNQPPILIEDQLEVDLGDPPPDLEVTEPDGDDWSVAVTGGDVPPGTSLAADGSWSGPTTETGTFIVEIRLCDDRQPAACADETVRVVVSSTSGSGGSGEPGGGGSVEDNDNGSGSGSTLPMTGIESSGALAALSAALMGAGVLLLAASQSRLRGWFVSRSQWRATGLEMVRLSRDSDIVGHWKSSPPSRCSGARGPPPRLGDRTTMAFEHS